MIFIPIDGQYYLAEQLILNGKETKYYVTSDGKIINIEKKMFIKQYNDGKGYQLVRLKIDGRGRNYLVHRLVAMTYIDNPDNKPQVNHMDGNKKNNDVTNLEWVTNNENMQHAILHNLTRHPTCEDHGGARITNKQVELACKLMEENELTQKEISDVTGIPTYTLYKIHTRKNWTDISDNYNIDNFTKNIPYSKEFISEMSDYIRMGYKPKKIAQLMNHPYSRKFKLLVAYHRKKL